MKEFNAFYSLSQRLLKDEGITTLIAVFEANVRICDMEELKEIYTGIEGNELRMINGPFKQITIKIK